MRILIDIGHPAHVHLFKNIVLVMQKRGHSFFFTVRSGENETVLLDELGFKYEVIGRKRRGVVLKIAGLLLFTSRIVWISRRFKPDLFLSHGSMYAGYASRFCKKPHIALEDSGNREQTRFSLPVSDAILSPDVLQEDYGYKHIRYKGYHELMYLSPKYFNPDRSVLSSLANDVEKPYAILRFVSWEASHDRGNSGLSLNEKKMLIQYLVSRKIKVFISAERTLPMEFQSYKLDIPFEKIHDALAFASIYVGEGATMASEAGILGVPSFYINTIRRCYNDDQEKYGTVYNFSSFYGAIAKIEQVLSDPQARETHNERASRLINDKIDVTSFMVWFIENWPESFRIIKANPGYLHRPF